MFINPESLNTVMLWLGWVVFGLFFAYALFAQPWKEHVDTRVLTVLPAFVVGLTLLWVVKAGLIEGLEVHVLGITALTLMFGTRLSILAISGLYALLAVLGKVDWAVFGWNVVLVGVLQILLAAHIHRFIYQRFPQNYFVFVFLSSFLNGALVITFTMLLLVGFMWLTSAYPPELIQSQFLQLTPLLIFPEAFVNGGLMAVMVIYRPQWVSGFDQNRYMRG